MNENNKKLYLVTCNSDISHTSDTFDVYVIAHDEKQASDKALSKMRDLSYKYTSFVSKIILLAGEERFNHPKIIII